jgi:hypothetical protein
LVVGSRSQTISDPLIAKSFYQRSNIRTKRLAHRLPEGL